MKRELDFIVIGAAKSATTSLYELLKSHPEIHIPKAKEVPFFSDDAMFARGVQYYFRSYFQHADRNALWGTVTPQYMLDNDTVSVEKIADRIYNTFPKTKIIALLRNPAERAYSHYKMQVQRGHESRSFISIVQDTLHDPVAMRKSEMPDESYIFASEYGRILEAYYSLFPKENILVITTDELQDQPVQSIRRICSFIGADTTYAPPHPLKRHREGGSKPRFKFLTPGFLYSIPFVEKIWKTKTNPVLRKKIEYAINLWNTRKDKSQLHKDGKAYHKLMNFFKDDTETVERLTNKKMPWSLNNETDEPQAMQTIKEATQ